jgi:hypothetical protein
MRSLKCFIISMAVLVFFSCSKENQTEGKANIAGNWVFVGLQNRTTSINSYITNGHTSTDVLFSSYKSSRGTGKVSITSDSIIGSGIGYSYNLFQRLTDYEDNVLSSDDSILIPSSAMPANSSIKFEYIGKDSVHYISGTLTGSNGSGTSLTTGAKISLTGDTLVLTSGIYFNDTANAAPFQISGTVVTTLKRQ